MTDLHDAGQPKVTAEVTEEPQRMPALYLGHGAPPLLDDTGPDVQVH